jgi:hypothetical protein
MSAYLWTATIKIILTENHNFDWFKSRGLVVQHSFPMRWMDQHCTVYRWEKQVSDRGIRAPEVSSPPPPHLYREKYVYSREGAFEAPFGRVQRECTVHPFW